MANAKVTFKDKDLYVNGKFITDISVCDIWEIEDICEKYGIQKYYEEIVEKM